MYTSSPSSFLNPKLSDYDTVKKNDIKKLKENGIEGEKQKGKRENEVYGPTNRLVEDVYKPSHRINTMEKVAVDSKMAMQNGEYSLSQSAQIKIQTKEGDEITINFDQALENSRNAFYLEQGRSSITGYTESYSFESEFAVTIEGDLNEGEQKSLINLLEKINKVTNDFFNGDVKFAFKHAQKVGFDTAQIAGFSIDLNREESVHAVAAYKQTAFPEQNINTNVLKQAREFLADTKDFISDTKSILDSLIEPKQTFSDLFNLIGELNYGELEGVEKEDQQILTDIIHNLGDGLFSNT